MQIDLALVQRKAVVLDRELPHAKPAFHALPACGGLRFAAQRIENWLGGTPEFTIGEV